MLSFSTWVSVVQTMPLGLLKAKYTFLFLIIMILTISIVIFLSVLLSDKAAMYKYRVPSVEFIKSLLPALFKTSTILVTVEPEVGM